MTAIALPRTDNVRGAALLAVSAVVFTVEAVLLRHLGTRIDFFDVVLFRAVAQLIFATAWVLGTTGVAGLRTNRPGFHLLRGILSLFCWWFYYASFAMLDLALATLLTFTTSLFTVALAGPVMGERVGVARTIAALIGFAGVVIASGLASFTFEPAVLLGIAAAAGSACIVMANRHLAATETTPTIMFYIGVVTTCGALPILLVDPTLPAPADALVLAAVSAAGCLGMWLSIEAYRIGEVSAMAPVPYLRLVFASAAGLLLFGEQPAPTVWAGATLIVGSALIVALRRSAPRS